jgi:hypothetical protein
LQTLDFTGFLQLLSLIVKSETKKPGIFGINKKKVIFPGFQHFTTKKRG